MNNVLLIIDPQNDFCHAKGALSVRGAEQDCLNLSNMIERVDSKLSSIHVTMDSHHLFHIAHPIFWLDKNGNHPLPFTVLTSDNIRKGDYKPSVPFYSAYVLDYLETLENTGKYDLCIWPPHCLIGTWGHNVFAPLSEALANWELHVPGRVVNYTFKGSNLKTEHYSAIRAEVSDAADPNSRTNFALIDKLKGADNIAIAGEALSHCVANTVRDLLTVISPEKLIVLTDVSSNVAGFESLGQTFLNEAAQVGVRLMTSVEFLA